MLESRYTISFDLREPPDNGKAQIVFRCAYVDRDLVSAAAALLGISVNKFMRTVVIQSARQVLKENTEPQPIVSETKFRIEDTMLPPGVKPSRG